MKRYLILRTAAHAEHPSGRQYEALHCKLTVGIVASKECGGRPFLCQFRREHATDFEYEDNSWSQGWMKVKVVKCGGKF